MSCLVENAREATRVHILAFNFYPREPHKVFTEAIQVRAEKEFFSEADLPEA